MTPEQQIEDLLKLTRAQNAILTTVSRQLERMAQASAPASPNYRRRLSEYPIFEWSEIGATVAAQDNQGVSEVEWNLHRFTRRAGSGKFGKAIWFSRPTGKEGDETSYARLITFKDGDAEPVPGDVAASVALGEAQATPRPVLVKPSQEFIKTMADDPGKSPQGDTINPLDIYKTETRAPIAAAITGDPRQAFYKLGGDATGKEIISFEVFNRLVSRANKEGYEAALNALQEILSGAGAVELIAAAG